MEPELKALIDSALERGASQSEIRDIVMQYRAAKKKGQSPQESQSETQVSTDSTSIIAQRLQEEGGASASLPPLDFYDPYLPAEQQSNPVFRANAKYFWQGEEISQEDANVVATYGDAYNNAIENYVTNGFDASRYWRAKGWNTDFLSSYTQEEVADWSNSVLEDLKSQSGVDEEGNPINPYSVKEVLDDILLGVDDRLSRFEQNKTAERTAAGFQRGQAEAATAGPLATAISPWALRQIERQVGKDPEQIDDRYNEQNVESIRNKAISEARATMNAAVIPQVTAEIRSLINEETLADPEAVMKLERRLYDDYGIMADINNSGYIGVDDGEGGRNNLADFAIGTISEVVKLTGTASVALGDVMASAYGIPNATAPESMRGFFKNVESELEKHRAIALTDPASKLHQGDFAGGISDIFADMGHSVPMMAAAIVTQRATGSSMATMGVVSAMGATTAYDMVRDEEWFKQLDTVQQGGFILGYGLAEGAPALVGAKIFERFRGLTASSNNVSQYLRGMLLNTPLAMSEEALTEAVTGGAQYILEASARGQEIDLAQLDSAIQNGFYAGAAMGGGMAGAGSVISSLGLAASSIPAVRSKLVIRELEKQLRQETTAEGRKQVMAAMSKAVAEASRAGAERRAFYEQLREADPESHSRLASIQMTIQKLAIEHNREGVNKSRKRSIRNEINMLLKERAKMESALDQRYDLNSRTETNRIIENVAKVQEEYVTNLEQFFEGKNSMVVTPANSNAMLERVQRMMVDRTNMYLPFGIGRISSPEAMQEGLANTLTAVRALTATKPGFKGIVLHRTIASMSNATRGNVGRGVHMEKGKDGYKIHLLVPAIMENTAYHEAYHELGLESLLGADGMRGLALTLANSLSGNKLVNKFNSYLQRVVQNPQVQAQLSQAGIEKVESAKLEELMNSPLFAEEFLAELLADITTGKLEIEFKKGLVDSFASLINRGLEYVPFAGKIPTPSAADLASAIRSVTTAMAEGRSVQQPMEQTKAAVGRMNYPSLVAMVKDDEESGKPKATIDDVREATPKEYAEAMARAEERDAATAALRGKKLFLQVTMLSEADAQAIVDAGGKLFVTKDLMGGAYVTGDGYMGGLFKNPDSPLSSISKPLQDAREAVGGKYFDAFATKLEKRYIANGWKPVSRVKFNEEYAPDGWDEADSPLRGRPDVVFFVKGEGVRGGGVMTESWDAAFEVAQASLEGDAKFQGPLKYLEEDMSQESFFELTGIDEATIETRKAELKLEESQRQKQNPELRRAVEALRDGNITQEEYIRFVREESPIKPFDKVPQVPSLLDVSSSLKSSQVMRGVYNLNKEIPEGYYVGLRLDIPAYNDYDVWVVSVHQGKSGDARTPSLGGKSIAYSQTGYISNVEFASSPLGSLNIAAEKTSKTTIARMFGDWKNHNPEELQKRAERIMKGDSYNADYKEVGVQKGWVQVGMNPYRHSWFYDKRDGRPVIAAAEVIQIGSLVLAKDVEKVAYNDARFGIKKFISPDGETVKFQDPLNDVKLMGQYAQSVKDQASAGPRVGQGYISAVRAENRGDNDYMLQRQYVRTNFPSTYIRHAEYLANTEIVLAERRFRSNVWKGKNAMKYADEVYEIFISGVKDNLLWLHDQFDDTYREVSTLWYDGANIMAQQMADEYGLQQHQVAAVIAALSPQKDWFQNIRLAEMVLESFVKRGNEPVNAEMIEYMLKEGKSVKVGGEMLKWGEALRMYEGQPINSLPDGPVRAIAVWAYSNLYLDRSYDILAPNGMRGEKATTEKGEESSAAWGTLVMISKAIKATTSADIDVISELLGNEHKIRNFYNNIINPGYGYDATIDTHAVAAAHLLPLAGSDYQVLANFGSANPWIKDGKYYSDGDVANMAKAAGIKDANKNKKGTFAPWAKANGFEQFSLPNNKSFGVSGGYFYYLEAYQLAAAERGILPREMQSITWEAVRLLYEKGFKNEGNKNDIRALHEKYANGELTKEQLREQLLERAGGIGKPAWSEVIDDVVRRVDREVPESRSLDGTDAGDRGPGLRERGARTDEGDVSPDVKYQGDLVSMIADFIDKEYSNPSIRRDRRRKNPVWLEESTGQLSAFILAKQDVINLLTEMGMDKTAAEDTYRMAYQYKRGRLIGKKEVIRSYKGLRSQVKTLSTEAKNLKKSLEMVRDKSKTFNEFLGEAIKLIDERMKELGKTPFNRGDLTLLVKIIRRAHRVSPKRIEKQGFDIMQGFIEKISEMFDVLDSKKAMRLYIEQLNRIKRLQTRLRNESKTRAKGEALKSKATYYKYAESLAQINAALIGRGDIDSFERALNATLSSMSIPTVITDEDGRTAVSFPKLPARDLAVLVSKFQSLEELGREAYFIARAEQRALRNKTSIEEEYAKLKKAYERSKLSTNRRKILDYIEEWNKNNAATPLDSTNPAHIEQVLQALYEEKMAKEDGDTQLIIDEVLLPRIFGNIEALLEEPMIADILGVYSPANLDLLKLRDRLLRLSRRQVAHLDYKLDDYLVNGSVFGLGYVHSLVRGSIDYADELSELQSKGLKARNKVYVSFLDTVDSYLRMVFPATDAVNAKLRRALGFGSIEGAFGRADFIHSAIVEKIEAKVLELEKKSKTKLTGVKENAIMQLFSMSRQAPQQQVETQPGQNNAEWYVNLKGVMQRTIEYYQAQQVSAGGSYSAAEIEEMKSAYEFLFGDTNGLEDIQQKVAAEYPEMVELVDFMVDVHAGLSPQFSNYVERYLGKELVWENNYTPFDVRVETKSKEVNESMRMYEGFHKALQESSLAHAKRAAGSSFERNPRSLSGDKAIIGLNFLSINESTLRENVTLMETVGSTLAHRFVMNSESAKSLMPNDAVRSALEGKIARYVHQDTGKTPAFFQKDFVLLGKRIENPAHIIRQAVVVNAFGGLVIQTFKQSTVLINSLFQSKNPLQTFPYVMQTIAEMVYYSGKGLFMKDSKIALDSNGRYKLLQNSPVFSRDYESGNINPFTGAMNFDSSRFQKAVDYMTKASVKNLKGTDKIAAIASWFGFYADSLLQQGAIESISEINWDSEAVSPNKEALSYADSMVTKDQAASTPRQAADLYSGGTGFADVFTFVMQNMMLPFSRFAVNKKRSIVADTKKLLYGDKQAKIEGTKALVGSYLELLVFHSIAKVALPMIASVIYSDDEERKTSEEDSKAWMDVITSATIDFLPQIPLGMIDDAMRHLVNKYIIFPFAEEDNFGIGDESYNDRFERWQRVKGGVPVYGSSKSKSSPVLNLLSYIGPYGDFLNNAGTSIYNAAAMASGSNKVVSSTGREYYIRPEDKDKMALYFFLRSAVVGANIIGLGNKESEMILKKIDDLPVNRSLGSEEELAAYESILKAMQSNNPELIDVLKDIDSVGAQKRLSRMMSEVSDDPMLMQTVSNKFSKGMNDSMAENVVRTKYPDTFSKHIAELRDISRRVTSSRDYYVLMRAKAEDMPAAEFKEFKDIATLFFSITSAGKINTDIYLQSIDE